MSTWQGRVLEINLRDEEGAEPRSVNEVRAVPGKGLEGDRYFKKAEAGKQRSPEQAVTFIEQEALDALHRDYEIRISGADSRRNVLVEGAPLNHLIGREFRVGDCRFLGRELCEPCGFLESRTKKGVRKGLIHRGGLRAEILSGGVLRTGDTVREA